MKTLASYLMAISLSGAFKESDWKSWAEQKIISQNKIEKWIYDIYNSKDINMLSNALLPVIKEEDFYKNNNYQYSDGIIGYYYLRYLKNELSLEEMLILSIEEVINGDSLMNKEKFEELLNEVEEHSELLEDKKFLEKVDDFYYPFRIIAEKQIYLLNEIG